MTFNKKVFCNTCEIQLTIGCNNRCVYCYAGARQTKVDKEMPLDMFKHICRRLKQEASCRKLTLTGGEPTTHKHFKDMVTYARETFPDWQLHLQTNGRWLSKMENAVFIALAGVDSLNVSFQSMDKDVHDALDGVKGAHGQVVEAINNILTVSAQYHKPSLGVNITLSKKNLPGFEKTLKYLHALGVKGISTNIMRINRQQEIIADLGLTDQEAAGWFLTANDISRAAGKGFQNLHSFNLCQHDATASGLFHYACAIGRQMIFINHKGEIIPCSFLTETDHPPIGNLNDSVPLSDIWQGEIFEKYRNHEYAHETCKSCQRLDECGGVCMAVRHVVNDQDLHPFIALS